MTWRNFNGPWRGSGHWDHPKSGCSGSSSIQNLKNKFTGFIIKWSVLNDFDNTEISKVRVMFLPVNKWIWSPVWAELTIRVSAKWSLGPSQYRTLPINLSTYCSLDVCCSSVTNKMIKLSPCGVTTPLARA